MGKPPNVNRLRDRRQGQRIYFPNRTINIYMGSRAAAKEENRYEYRTNVNHAVGVSKDRLIRILIADDSLTRKYLYRELVSEMRRRTVFIRPNQEVGRKEYLKKPHFHHNHRSNC
jgi:hypothetical protein